MTGTTITLLIADDHPLARSGLAAILAEEPDIEIVGQASDGDEAVLLAQRLRPDVVFMDVRMPGVNGVEATRRILATTERTRVVMLTTFDLDEHVYDALRAGAAGFLLKDTPPDQLCDAVRRCAAGETMLSPPVLARMVDKLVALPPARHAPDSRLADLTERETEVLTHLARGMSNAEIGRALFLSEATVKTHVGRVLTKLGLRDRVQAVVFAYESGLATPGSRHSDADPG